MLNVPLKLRNHNGPCTPDGPAFSSAQRFDTKIDDNLLSVTVPKQRAESAWQSKNPKTTYDLSQQQYESIVGGKEGWLGTILLSRVWNFYGPFFSGKQGYVTASLLIASPEQSRSHLSFFNPRVFESAVADFLRYRYFSDLDLKQKMQPWFAPVNWKPEERFNTMAASFDVTANKKCNASELIRCLVLAVDHKHIAVLAMQIDLLGERVDSSSNESNTGDNLVDIKPFVTLTENVIDNVHFQPSKEGERRRSVAIDGLEDPKLSKNFPPLKWLDIDDPRSNSGEKLEVF